MHSFHGLQSSESFPESVVFKFPFSDTEISRNEFIAILPEIFPFFYKINDFFSLSSASVYFGDHEMAYSYIRHGLNFSLKHRDFRMIGYYCKLASLNHFFTRGQLRQIYDGLNSDKIAESMTAHEYNVYCYEMDRIRRILIDRPFGLPQVCITVTTSINHDDIEAATRLAAHLSHAVDDYYPDSNSYIVTRHNSPYSFELILADNLVNLYNCAFIISTSIFGLTKLISKIQKIIYDSLKISGLKLDVEKKKIEVEMAKIDADRKRASQTEARHGASMVPAQTGTPPMKHLPPGLADQVTSVKLSVSADVKVDQRIRELTFTR
jgi:hypothetical protein